MASEDVEGVGRVTVTGSRIKTVDIEGATPTTVITRADIDAAGYGTVYETVSNLTQAIGEVSGENFRNSLPFTWSLTCVILDQEEL